MAAFPAQAAGEHSVIDRVTRGGTGGSSKGIVGLTASSPDGSSFAYRTPWRLAPEDTDGSVDVYRWTNGVNELLSIGPAGGNGPVDPDGFQFGASDDVSHVFWVTPERLVPEDTDGERDIYERAGDTTRLVTSGSVPGLAGTFSWPRIHHVSQDGSRVVFSTTEALVAQDDDGTVPDVYQRSGGVTRLVTARADGSNGSGFYPGSTVLPSTSLDGSRVWFTSNESLVPEDTDSASDIYEHSGGTTTLVSDVNAGAAGLDFAGASDDGSRIFIFTGAVLSPDDTDTQHDLYQLTPGGAVLVSTGPGDVPEAADPNTFPTGPTHFAAITDVSSDGTRVLFRTGERMLPSLPIGEYLYERSGGMTKVISGPPIDGVAPRSTGDGRIYGDTIYHTTRARLVSEDTDSTYDVYAYSGGANRLVSIGPADADPFIQFWGATEDGSRAFVVTNQQWLPADNDSDSDIYENHAGTMSLVTPAPTTGPSAGVAAHSISRTGVVFFTTLEQFGDDNDAFVDTYAARIADTSGYPRPLSASPQKFPLVPAYRPCQSPNRTHGPPLAFPSCSPPVQGTSRLTVGTFDANGEAPNSRGQVRLASVVGNPATPVDEADVRIQMTDLDVRVASPALSDYTGELLLELGLRITDRDGPTPAGGGPAPVTQQDLAFSVGVPCTLTLDTATGSSCSVQTTADSVVPGAVVERRRTIWALRHIRVLDGGNDGDAGTADGEELFQVQGLFVP